MATTKVTALNNGPLRLEGEFEICDGEGKAFGLAGQNGDFAYAAAAIRRISRSATVRTAAGISIAGGGEGIASPEA